MRSVLSRVAGAIAVVALMFAPLLVLAAAQASSVLSCRASMSNSTPQQYSYVTVYVATAAGAKARTSAQYKTTTTVHVGKANSAGHASIPYYISSATAGYRVYVYVTVSKGGRSASCSTSFVPHSR